MLDRTHRRDGFAMLGCHQSELVQSNAVFPGDRSSMSERTSCNAAGEAFGARSLLRIIRIEEDKRMEIMCGSPSSPTRATTMCMASPNSSSVRK
jgi:hypothetical protein